MLFFEYDFEDEITKEKLISFLSDEFGIATENVLSEEKYFDNIGSNKKYLGLNIFSHLESPFKTQIIILINFEINEIERYTLGLKFAKNFNTKVITGDYLQRSEFVIILPNEKIKFIALNIREDSEIINISFESKEISHKNYVKQCYDFIQRMNNST